MHMKLNNISAILPKNFKTMLNSRTKIALFGTRHPHHQPIILS